MQTYRHLCLALLTLLGSLALTVTVSHALLVDLPLSDSTITVGETFTIQVSLSDVFGGLDPSEEVLAFGFGVVIGDPALVSFLGATVASPFMDDVFPDTAVAGSVFPGVPNDGTHDTLLLATLAFEALALGPVAVGISSDISDLNEGLVYFLMGNVDITARRDLVILPGVPHVIPEPTTIVLLGTGLLGLLGTSWRRRR